jgi:hypothetical protein
VDVAQLLWLWLWLWLLWLHVVVVVVDFVLRIVEVFACVY